LVFSGVIDNSRNSMEEVVRRNGDGCWTIRASF